MVHILKSLKNVLKRSSGSSTIVCVEYTAKKVTLLVRSLIRKLVQCWLIKPMAKTLTFRWIGGSENLVPLGLQYKHYLGTC